MPRGRAGPAIAAVRTVGYLGSVVGPPLVGAAAEAVGLRAAFATVPVLALAMAALAVRLPVLARAGEPDG